MECECQLLGFMTPLGHDDELVFMEGFSNQEAMRGQREIETWKHRNKLNYFFKKADFHGPHWQSLSGSG